MNGTRLYWVQRRRPKYISENNNMKQGKIEESQVKCEIHKWMTNIGKYWSLEFPEIRNVRVSGNGKHWKIQSFQKSNKWMNKNTPETHWSSRLCRTFWEHLGSYVRSVACCRSDVGHRTYHFGLICSRWVPFSPSPPFFSLLSLSSMSRCAWFDTIGGYWE